MSRHGAGTDDAARQRFHGRFPISADIDRQHRDVNGMDPPYSRPQSSTEFGRQPSIKAEENSLLGFLSP